MTRSQAAPPWSSLSSTFTRPMERLSRWMTSASQCAPARIFGILGRNGAGKTTTVECLSGLRAPDSGRLDILGLDPREDRRELHERVGVQLQESALPPKIRVGEVVELYASFYRRPADGDHLLGVLGLDEKRGSYLPRALRRPEAAAIHRPRPHRPARNRDLGRADDGSRSRGAARDVGTDRRRARQRGHDRPCHPLHGGGRTALRPGGAHRPRQGHRSRSARAPGRAGVNLRNGPASGPRTNSPTRSSWHSPR